MYSLYQKTVVHLCRLTIRLIYTVFNTIHVILDMNNIHNFKTLEEYLREFERIKKHKVFNVLYRMSLYIERFFKENTHRYI